MMSRCFTWFPFGELVEPNIYHQSVCFTRNRDFTWRVSDCEELVGGFTGDDGVSLPFVLLEQLLDHKISHVYDQQVHEII